MHEDEVAGAIGCLRLTGAETTVPEERGLLVARDPRDRRAHVAKRAFGNDLARCAGLRQQ